jgi:nitronate monooxygenase
LKYWTPHGARLEAPVIAAPLFIISTPQLVVAQCKAGIVGSMPALNARPIGVLDQWLREIREALDQHNQENPGRPSAPFAINLIVHKSNQRIDEDLAACVRHRVPIVITSLSCRPDVNDAIHRYGGIVLHDVTTLEHAHKATERGADGLIAVAAGAGGHAGRISPIALVQEIRQWWNGPLLLSGCIATGRSVLAAQVLGADMAYVGTRFISSSEANAVDEYKNMVLESSAADVIYTDYFTGIAGNYLRGSIERAGLDPVALPTWASSQGAVTLEKPKSWKEIWGAGQGVGLSDRIEPASAIVERLVSEYRQALVDLKTTD